MLTEDEILAPNLTGKREKRSDGHGLRLLVTPGGARSWEIAYRWEGRQRTLPIGSFPAVTAAEARFRCEQVRAALARGEDPGTGTKRATIEQAETERARKFDAVAEAWFRSQVVAKCTPGYAARVWARVAADLLPELGHMDVASISSGDVLRVLQAIEARGAVYSAKRVGRYAAGIFDFARVAHGLGGNPAERLNRALRPNPPVVGQPALPPDQVRDFCRAMLQPHQDEPATRLGLELVMHTLLRSTELRGGRWSEIVGDEWRVPAERMKSRRPHVVPLSKSARRLIARLREHTGRGPLMFPGKRPGHAISENTILFAVYGLGFKGRASIHGWRATFSTWAHGTGRWPSEWIEACLAHVDGNEVRRAYNRQDWLPQRREIMTAWSEWLDLQRGIAQDLDELI